METGEHYNTYTVKPKPPKKGEHARVLSRRGRKKAKKSVAGSLSRGPIVPADR